MYAFVLTSLTFFQICLSVGSFAWFLLGSLVTCFTSFRLLLFQKFLVLVAGAKQLFLSSLSVWGFLSPNFYTPQVVESGSFSFFGTYSFLPNFSILFYFVSVSTLIALLLFTLPWLLKPAVSGFEKNSSYECGFEPFVCKNEVFESHFLVVGVLFLLFDLELIFLFPLGAVAPTYDTSVPLSVLPFLILLLLAFIFEYVRGALIWPVFYARRTGPQTHND